VVGLSGVDIASDELTTAYRIAMDHILVHNSQVMGNSLIIVRDVRRPKARFRFLLSFELEHPQEGKVTGIRRPVWFDGNRDDQPLVPPPALGEHSDEILAEYLPGDVFGEIALVAGTPRCTNVTVSEDSEIFVFTRDHLDRLMKTAPELAAKVLLNISQTLSRRLIAATHGLQRKTV